VHNGLVYVDELLAERTLRDRFMVEHYASPLPEDHLDDFTGLDWFDPDPAWRLSGTWVAVPPAKQSVPTSSGGVSAYTLLGSVVVEIDGSDHRLLVFDDGDGSPFIPFRDATCGTVSYAGGRYVPVRRDEGEAIVDFNRAHNPLCAYDPEFVCPLPPPENWLACRVPAGERDYRLRR
jgi:uncharacterized protein (DUF1684 family)